MKVTQTEMEVQCGQYSEKFKKNWDYYCLVQDAYINGYRQAKSACLSVLQDEKNILTSSGAHEASGYMDMSLYLVEGVGTEKSEVEYKDGAHMIGAKSTDSLLERKET